MSVAGENAKGGVKGIFGILKKNPALMITAIGAALLVGYILIKRGGSTTSNVTQPDGTTLPNTQLPGGYYMAQQPYVEPPVVINNPLPVPVSPTNVSATINSAPPTGAGKATVPSTSQDDIVRTRYGNPVVAAYDRATPQGVPIRSAPAGGNDITGYAGYGSKVQITGPAVRGTTSNLPANMADKGTQFWYPVAGGGYISGFDVQSSFPAAKTKATVPSNG